MADHYDWYLNRPEIVEAIGKIAKTAPTVEVRIFLISLLRDTLYAVKLAAAQALSAMSETTESPGVSRAVFYWVENLDEENNGGCNNVELVIYAAKELGALNSKYNQAIPIWVKSALVACMRNINHPLYLRIEAAVLLASQSGDATIPEVYSFLVTCLESDSRCWHAAISLISAEGTSNHEVITAVIKKFFNHDVATSFWDKMKVAQAIENKNIHYKL